jgi:hypothetical protein
MPKNKVSDPITDQEIAFACLVLSGAVTDRHAAEAVGLNPDSAAYTKSKPRVRAYMLEHRAAVPQQPPSPTALAPRRHRRRPLMSPYSLLLQTRERVSLQERTPLPTPAELPIAKNDPKISNFTNN